MGQRVLITGCSTGIGRALAQVLAERGHDVIATARRPDSLQDLRSVRRLPLDVTDERSVAAAVAAAGPIDVLVNNAGVGAWGAVEAASAEQIQVLFETNLFGPLRMLRAVLPSMRARHHGAIYQVSSAAAQRSNALLGHYAASKAALEAYSEALRIELSGFGIKVTIVILGAVMSAFAGNRRSFRLPDYDDLTERVKRRIESSRRSPDSAADVAARIADAIESGHSPVRLYATQDARSLVAERNALNDEDWERSCLDGLNPGGVK